MGGFTTALFVVKIKDEDETLEAWNFTLNLFKPSYADLVKNLFGSSAARSHDTAVNPKSAKMTGF